MKKVLTLSIIVISLFINSCTVNSTILNPVINENSTKIKSLKFGLEGDNIYKATHITTETYQSYNTTLFKRTIANNILLDNNDGEWGYIDLTRTFDIYKWRGLNFTSWLGPLIMTGFYGNPMDFVREIQYEISIYDSNRNLIRTYVYDDKTVIWLNIYNAQVAPLKAQMEQVNRICRKLEASIESDAEYINAQLEKAGKIES